MPLPLLEGYWRNSCVTNNSFITSQSLSKRLFHTSFEVNFSDFPKMGKQKRLQDAYTDLSAKSTEYFYKS